MFNNSLFGIQSGLFSVVSPLLTCQYMQPASLNSPNSTNISGNIPFASNNNDSQSFASFGSLADANRTNSQFGQPQLPALQMNEIEPMEVDDMAIVPYENTGSNINNDNQVNRENQRHQENWSNENYNQQQYNEYSEHNNRGFGRSRHDNFGNFGNFGRSNVMCMQNTFSCYQMSGRNMSICNVIIQSKCFYYR